MNFRVAYDTFYGPDRGLAFACTQGGKKCAPASPESRDEFSRNIIPFLSYLKFSKPWGGRTLPANRDPIHVPGRNGDGFRVAQDIQSSFDGDRKVSDDREIGG